MIHLVQCMTSLHMMLFPGADLVFAPVAVDTWLLPKSSLGAERLP